MHNKQQLAEFLRVDHAGERAAQTIYKGQLAVLKNKPAAKEIQHMMEQEQVHLDTFDTLLNQYQVCPSLLDPVWGFAGFSLGMVSAALGPKAAMACTIAVEEVIGGHYQKQVDVLELTDVDPDLVNTLAQFRDEELEHKDIAVASEGEKAPAYQLLKFVVQTGCKAAIKVAEKI